MSGMGQKEWNRCLELQLEPVLIAADSGAGLSTYTDMPFGIFLYPPDDEWELRQELRNLVIRLENAGKTVQRLSMAQLLEQALAAAGLSMEEIADGEKTVGLEMVRDTIRDVLSGKAAGSTPLDELVVQAVDASKPTSSHIVFLERVGVLFDLHRPSALLENLRTKVIHPVVLFYPGQRDGPAGLRFMDEAEADHNYRPKLFA
ncbi:BREX protein BrxB domain-containing protein [Synechococcus sp. CCY 0621]|uniref:BREX protein BrxB domain-containing protein n=1 Tax=Synechococcus sp. CCY 0621 TaxID=2815603 RepID=UPI001C245883|nr:BREX protein BrxB domain-containing protein [Synechococcus sp. CCY 0621]